MACTLAVSTDYQGSMLLTRTRCRIGLLCVVSATGKKKKTAAAESMEQTDPPSIPVADLFRGRPFPEGEWQQYQDECGPLTHHECMPFLQAVPLSHGAEGLGFVAQLPVPLL